MHPAQLRVLPYARSAPGGDKTRSHTPVLALVPGGGGRAWPGFETTRRAKLAARTASGRAAAPGHQHADKQENTSPSDNERHTERAARSAADGKRAARSAGFETTRRAKLAARTASGRAAAPGHQHADKQENTSSADGKRQLAARTPNGQLAARASRRHAERSSRRGRRAGGPPPPGTNTQNTRIQRGRDPPRQTAQRTPAS